MGLRPAQVSPLQSPPRAAQAHPVTPHSPIVPVLSWVARPDIVTPFTVPLDARLTRLPSPSSRGPPACAQTAPIAPSNSLRRRITAAVATALGAVRDLSKVGSMPEKEMGVVGLATMGMNLARNLASHGVRVGVYNRRRQRTDEIMAKYADEGAFKPAATLEELVHILTPPRAILLMVKAGEAVDEGIDALTALLEPGDTIIDGGNSLFHDTRRRAAAAARAGLGFLGMGVSGGEEGALRGPSLMPGGTRESYEHVSDMLTAIAAKVNGVPCCTYIGRDGAGHFVKMVHNGIEYADIQLIAESYDLLRSGLGLSPSELASIFREWNDGRLQSYLIEITANVLAKNSDGSGEALVD